ncbi:glycosyltransferase [Leucobacter sp. G161]|uniref:glycosyltransferase n=1 Tax=Leucobacter sp. G161 TaxID=663704 RepID=UPI00073D0AF0|nr:nucleotide disphospho-sugar-binding domain-containing protein [Leucobacter sp. G161]KUF06736.1 hypothetical protein AUL38_12020 [Leucobacter sp. G161]
MRGWVPHETLLPATDLVIGHDGHSTTFKALAHGVPILVLPINPISDQLHVGRTLETAGLARLLARTATASQIRTCVTEMLDDEELQARVAAADRRLRRAPPGGEVAAARILATLKRTA